MRKKMKEKEILSPTIHITLAFSFSFFFLKNHFVDKYDVIEKLTELGAL